MEDDVARAVARHAPKVGRPPTLAVVLVGDDAASDIYVRRKAQACERVGVQGILHRLPRSTPESKLLALVARLNGDPGVDGILVQLPLPPGIDKGRVLKAVAPSKDVDAFHPESVGHTLLGTEALAPCTPQAILHLLDDAAVPLRGAEVVVINHSNLIGKPLAALLINRDATVTVCHKGTRDLAAHTRRADVVITATGVADLLRAKDIRPGAVVVDAGIVRRADGSVRGDCHDDVWTRAAAVTPVPGGVGPMTVAVLLHNTLRAFLHAHGLPERSAALPAAPPKGKARRAGAGKTRARKPAPPRTRPARRAAGRRRG